MRKGGRGDRKLCETWPVGGGAPLMLVRKTLWINNFLIELQEKMLIMRQRARERKREREKERLVFEFIASLKFKE